jgi:putative hydrolase of HD superfamily
MNTSMHAFLIQAYELKSLPRAGWIHAGLSHPESVAAHSWGISLLISVLAPQHLNREKMYEMALTHDLPEIITGDITPHDGIPKEEKKKREGIAAKDLLPPHLHQAWLEYERNETEEAQFVHMLDKLDMGLQALVYREEADTQEFIDSASPHIPKALQELLYPLLT